MHVSHCDNSGKISCPHGGDYTSRFKVQNGCITLHTPHALDLWIDHQQFEFCFFFSWAVGSEARYSSLFIKCKRHLVGVVTSRELLAGVQGGGVLSARGLRTNSDGGHAETSGVGSGGSLADILGGGVLSAGGLRTDGRGLHAEALGVSGGGELADILGGGVLSARGLRADRGGLQGRVSIEVVASSSRSEGGGRVEEGLAGETNMHA